MLARGSLAAYVGTGVAIWTLAVGVPCQAQSARELVEKLEKKRAALKTLYHATKTTTHVQGATREMIVEAWEKRSGDGVRVRQVTTTIAQGGNAKSAAELKVLTVSDGAHQWREMLAGGKVMVMKRKVPPYQPLLALETALRMGKLRYKGHEHIRREPCVVFEASESKRKEGAKTTYWVSETYGVILRSITKRAGDIESEMTTTDLKTNEPVDDTLFVYTPPEGATVVDADAIGKPPKRPTKP